MRVYVAASSQEVDRARYAMRAVERAGCELTHDWTQDLAAVGCAQGYALPSRRRREIAERDLMAIRRADVLWLLIPETRTAGAWAEWGYAWAVCPTLIASGCERDEAPLFIELADHVFRTDDLAAHFLKERDRAV